MRKYSRKRVIIVVQQNVLKLARGGVADAVRQDII
jgi:hypothetical protein